MKKLIAALLLLVSPASAQSIQQAGSNLLVTGLTAPTGGTILFTIPGNSSATFATWSVSTNYNCFSLAAGCTEGSMVGIAGKSGDANLYLDPATSGNVIARIGGFVPANDNTVPLGLTAQTFNNLFITLTNITTAQTGSVCYTTTTKSINYDNTNTCLTSSLRFKRDVHPLSSALKHVLLWQPIAFKYKEGDNSQRYGMLAEQLAEVEPSLVENDADGRPLKIKYIDSIAFLVAAIKEQQREIDELKRRR